jgi:outer membrane protein OmpA-like peptidoglycan-associated protein
MLAAMPRRRFGRGPGRKDARQFALAFEAIEQRIAAITTRLAPQPCRTARVRSQRAANRGNLPNDLPRVETVLDLADKSCACCGREMVCLGEDRAGRHSDGMVDIAGGVGRPLGRWSWVCHNGGTGPGNARMAELVVIHSSAAVLTARLTHFAIGSAVLRPDHQRFLEQEVAPRLRKGGSVTLVGLASRSGSAATNQALSSRRMEAVLQRLRQLAGSRFRVNLATGAGEVAAASAGMRDGSEDASGRAVLLLWWQDAAPPPPDPDLAARPKPVAGMYNRHRVALYARRFAKVGNPAFPETHNGSDCTNFVSQCMAIGGWPMIGGTTFDYNDDKSWWHGMLSAQETQSETLSPIIDSVKDLFGPVVTGHERYRMSHSWGGADPFARFLRRTGRATEMPSEASLVAGDILQLARNGTDVHHSMIVIGGGGPTLEYAQHTENKTAFLKDMKERILKGGDRIIFWKVADRLF